MSIWADQALKDLLERVAKLEREIVELKEASARPPVRPTLTLKDERRAERR